MARSAEAARLWRMMLLAAVVPVAALAVLDLAGVPLGKPGTLVYPYSDFLALRLATLPWLALPVALLAAGCWWTFGESRRRKWLGLALAATGVLGVGVWTFFAPPRFASQHFFNFSSPSQDGAFALEARCVGDVRDYLRDFPDRARQPPEAMKGTRVISNPPATTLLALAVDRALDHLPWLADAVGGLLPIEERTDPVVVDQATRALALGLSFLMLWLVAAAALYGAYRQFLEPGPALVLAVAAVISPMTLVFSPGKDPAQLLTVALLLWSWLVAWRSGSLWVAALFGGLAVAALMIGLVHLWIAWIVVFSAELVTTAEREARRRWLRLIASAAGGALTIAVVFRLAAHLDVIAAARAAQLAQAEVTRGPTAMPFFWQMLGVPLFALFCGTALWALSLWRVAGRVEDGPARLGGRMLMLCLAVMAITIGFTNAETPRLWIPFVPLILLGLALQLPLLRQPRPATARLLTALVVLQVAAAATQWAFMDMREAELRLAHDAASAPRLFE